MRAHKAGLMAGLMRSHSVQQWMLDSANAPLGAQLCRESWSPKGNLQQIGFSTLSSGVSLAVQNLGARIAGQSEMARSNSDLGFFWVRAVPGRPGMGRGGGLAACAGK